MASKHRIRMIEAYRSERAPTRFLSAMFRSPRKNYYDGQYVEIDVKRGSESIAIPLIDYSSGPHMNTADTFTSKKFKPPAYREGFPLTSDDFDDRDFGSDPYADANFQADLVNEFFDRALKLEGKIERAVELQAAQIFTTGKLNLTDQAGNLRYGLDFLPKATHFPTAGTAWNAPGADILGDLATIMGLNRDDGLSDTDRFIFGQGAFETAIKNDGFKERFNNNYDISMGRISAPSTTGDGGAFRGVVTVGAYTAEIWTYNAKYDHPETGKKTKYIPDSKVVALSSTARYDAAFAKIKQVAPPDPRVRRFIPSRIMGRGKPIDMNFNAGIDMFSRVIIGEIGSRPLLIPTAIDTISCLDTGI